MINKWQPIETAPKDGTIVDVWHDQYGRIVDTWWDDCWAPWDREGDTEHFTHWMPVPEPPR